MTSEVARQKFVRPAFDFIPWLALEAGLQLGGEGKPNQISPTNFQNMSGRFFPCWISKSSTLLWPEGLLINVENVFLISTLKCYTAARYPVLCYVERPENSGLPNNFESVDCRVIHEHVHNPSKRRLNGSDSSVRHEILYLKFLTYFQ